MTETVEVIVGIIGRAHGIRGDVGIDLRTDEPERRFGPGTRLRIEGGERSLTIAQTRDHSGRLLARFEECPDRTTAESLRGAVLVLDVAADERPVDEEEYYDRQLTGLRVLDHTGNEVGSIAEVVHLPGQDLLEIRTPAGSRLVPFVKALVPTVDLATGTVQLADVPGLLTDEIESD